VQFVFYTSVESTTPATMNQEEDADKLQFGKGSAVI
jgi:hypothetical protein